MAHLSATIEESEHSFCPAAEDNDDGSVWPDVEAGSAWRPGEALRKLREKRGILLEEIVRETRIPEGRLQALERDDYNAVGLDTFVVAYMRKYAKVLQVDSDVIVEKYKANSGSSLLTKGFPQMESSTAASESRSRRLRHIVRRFTEKLEVWQLLVGILAVWLISVFVFREDEALLETASDLNTAADELVATELVSGIDLASPGAQVVKEGAMPGLAATTSGNEPETGSRIVASTELASTELASTDLANTVIANNAAASSATASNLLTSKVANAEEGTDTAIVSPAGSGTADILTMSFTDECWVKVVDAEGEVIFAQLQYTGDNLRLSGKAPFNVLLGNARAAYMEFNGVHTPTVPAAGRRTLQKNVGP